MQHDTAGLFGIWDLDIEVPYYSASNIDEIAGFLSIRQVLYNHVKMSDGHSLFAEIRQQVGMANVEAIIPNTPEAGNMVEMMNNNMVANLRNYLPGEGIGSNCTLRASNPCSIQLYTAHGTPAKTKILSTP